MVPGGCPGIPAAPGICNVCRKSPFIHLVHSMGVYPNIPRVDPSRKGKIIGFMEDRTRFAAPQLVVLGKNVSWTWEDLQISMNMVVMTIFYRSQPMEKNFGNRTQGLQSSRCHAKECWHYHPTALIIVPLQGTPPQNCMHTLHRCWRHRN